MAINFLVCRSRVCFFTKIHHISYFFNDYSVRLHYSCFVNNAGYVHFRCVILCDPQMLNNAVLYHAFLKKILL
jgi:hypothetical protein